MLKAVGKGVTAEEMLRAGVALREAGLDLWAMILLGLAGAAPAWAMPRPRRR